MQDKGNFDSFSLNAFQNKSQVGCFCIYAVFLNAVKRLQFKANLVFPSA